MLQCVLRLLFLLGTVVGNVILVSGTSNVPLAGLVLTRGQAIVLFNAAVILFIYIVDWLIYKTMRARLEFEIGERLVEH